MINYRKVMCVFMSIFLLTGCINEEESEILKYSPPEDKKLVIYTSHKNEVWEPIVREFEERYDIWVDVTEGGTSELLEKIEEGDTGADVMFGGGIESLFAFKENFVPYRAEGSEYLRRSFVNDDYLCTPFSSLPIVLVYNPKLVSYGEITSWEDLLDEKFKGKIAFASPERSGSSFTALVTMIKALPFEEEETIRRFAENLDGKVMESSGEAINSVCSGENFVGISIEETAFKRIAENKELKVVYPRDGTACVPDGTAIIKNCPHEKNAQLFLDFTLSKDVQELLTDVLMRRSVRMDTVVKPPLKNLDNVKILKYDAEKAGKRRDFLLSSWKFFLGGEEDE